MARRRSKKPLNKLLDIHSKLRVYIKFDAPALAEQTKREFAAEIFAPIDQFDLLMKFRNIINGTVGFDEEPFRAVIQYLDDDEFS